jgi:hypothetical protein
LVVGLQRERLLRTVQLALRLIDRGVHQRSADVFQIKIRRIKLCRIDLDADRRTLQATDTDDADTRNL